MIIQRTEKEGIVRGFYKSSNILMSEFNKATKNLTITFNYGGVYTYGDVPEKDFTRFELAESQGKVLNSHIKQYSFTKLDNADVNALKEELNEIVKAEKKSFEDRLVEIASLIGENGLTDSLLKEFDETRAHLKTI